MNDLTKIMNEYSPPQNIAMSAIYIIGSLKGINLKVLKLKDTLANFFVIGSASNPVQAKAMAERILKHFKSNHIEIRSVEGMQEADWILIDANEVICHIFQEGIRELYNLEELWSKSSTEVEIPVSFYSTAKDDPDDYSKYF